MSSDVAVRGEIERKDRVKIPAQHRQTVDTRLAWLWNQKFAVVQNVWLHPQDQDDKLAATILLSAILTPVDLNAIGLLFKRLEGGSRVDEATLEGVLPL